MLYRMRKAPTNLYHRCIVLIIDFTAKTVYYDAVSAVHVRRAYILIYNVWLLRNRQSVRNSTVFI